VTAATLGDTHITVIADPFDAKAYLSLFLEGVATRIQTGMAVRTFLCERLGLNPSYVSEQITTVFLNGSVVEPETLEQAPSSREGLVSFAVLTETMRTDSI
jgi:hypothetical protein